MPVSQWLPPVLVATGVAAIGWMIRYILTSLTDKLDDLETTFAKVAGDLATQHAALAEKLNGVDRRVIQLESWRDLLHFADPKSETKP